MAVLLFISIIVNVFLGYFAFYLVKDNFKLIEEKHKTADKLDSIERYCDTLIKTYRSNKLKSLDNKTQSLLNLALDKNTNINEAKNAALLACKRVNKLL